MPMSAPRKTQRGFTAVEAMLVVAILAILAAFAAPAMNQLIRTQKVRSIAYDLNADLLYARSEAISRGHNVGVGGLSGTNWINGWRVLDFNNGQTLRQQGARATGVSFVSDDAWVLFDRTGRIVTGNTQWRIEPSESGAPDTQKRCIRMSPSGRPNSMTGPCP